MDQPKEPDAGPQVRFCERRGGAIHRAYSTGRTHSFSGQGTSGLVLPPHLTCPLLTRGRKRNPPRPRFCSRADYGVAVFFSTLAAAAAGAFGSTLAADLLAASDAFAATLAAAATSRAAVGLPVARTTRHSDGS